MPEAGATTTPTRGERGAGVRLSLRRGDDLCAGDWVEVRSREEILATLDERGRLDGLPFMPEMLQYCGQRFRVFRSAHKTCDTATRTGGRRIDDTVHLDELRCDGAAHGGCEAACLLFWKDAWLRPVDQPAATSPSTGPGCSEEQLQAAVVASTDADGPVYACQATLVTQATTPLKWWDVRQYWQDWRRGNVGLREMIGGGVYVAVYAVIKRADRGPLRLRQPLVRIYDGFQRLRRGVPFPRRWGTIPAGSPTPAPPSLNLQPGELVRIKPYDQILDTLDTNNRNRGMFFDAEEVPYCGGTYRVRSQVNRIVDERSGRMIELKGNPVILDDVWCKGHYSDRRMFCPRAIYSFWKSAWLERVEPVSAEPPR